MEWVGEGVIIGVRPHGETSAIVEVLTAQKGRHAGIVKGGASRKMAATLQPGVQVQIEWRARLETHLGSFRIEPLRARSGILQDRLALAGLGAVSALSCFAFPERMALRDLYQETVTLLDAMDEGAGWLKLYALWELLVLEDLGYGLDLFTCAANGQRDDLIYVSPKSGRAISRQGAGEWADKLLPLPGFFLDTDASATADDILAAVRTTGYFLNRRVAPPLGERPLPAARERFINLLGRHIKAEQGP